MMVEAVVSSHIHFTLESSKQRPWLDSLLPHPTHVQQTSEDTEKGDMKVVTIIAVPVLIVATTLLCMATCTLGFVTVPVSHHHGDFISNSIHFQQVSGDMEKMLDQEDKRTVANASTRRNLLVGAVAAFVGLSTNQLSAHAVDGSTSTIWLTGKAPKVPGQKPKDKNDVSGTKKDPSFLRSIADCKSQCESLGKPKDECLSECQDICCTTYEQCTFAIVPRI